jgi:hypothetical protein
MQLSIPESAGLRKAKMQILHVFQSGLLSTARIAPSTGLVIAGAPVPPAANL